MIEIKDGATAETPEIPKDADDTGLNPLRTIRDIPHLAKIFLATSGLALTLSSCKPKAKPESPEKINPVGETFFGKEHYLDISGNVAEPYVDPELLDENLPTVYDNLLYAQSIGGVTKIENSSIYKICKNIEKDEEKIRLSAAKRGVPVGLVFGAYMVESAGGLRPGGSKGLNDPWACYGPWQISVFIGKHYGLIKLVPKVVPVTKLVAKRDHKGKIMKNKKGKTIFVKKVTSKKKTIYEREDNRGDPDASRDVACHDLSVMHNNYVAAGYADDNWSLAFASYHMGETNMGKILEVATQRLGHKPKTLQEVIGVNDPELAFALMKLGDKSYRYYPWVLAGARVYYAYKNDRSEFNANAQKFIDSPISRTTDLAEEGVRYGEKGIETTYYPDSKSMAEAVEADKLFGIPEGNRNDVILDKNQIGEHTKSKTDKELQKMTSKAIWGLIKFIAYYAPFPLRIVSLTRPEDYNTKEVYKRDVGKWTSHATSYAFDFGFPRDSKGNVNRINKLHLKTILFALECQGMIAFLEEDACFHVTINPRDKEFFEDIADGKNLPSDSVENPPLVEPPSGTLPNDFPMDGFEDWINGGSGNLPNNQVHTYSQQEFLNLLSKTQDEIRKLLENYPSAKLPKDGIKNPPKDGVGKIVSGPKDLPPEFKEVPKEIPKDSSKKVINRASNEIKNAIESPDNKKDESGQKMKVNNGNFTFIRSSESESGNMYYVYKYVIKSGGKPEAVKNAFRKNYGEFDKAKYDILITRKSGEEYPSDKKLEAGARVYIKVVEKKSEKKGVQEKTAEIKVGGFTFVNATADTDGDTSYVYRYVIKNGGKPEDVRRVFKGAFKRFSEKDILITTRNGDAYPSDKKFKPNDRIYVKVMKVVVKKKKKK